MRNRGPWWQKRLDDFGFRSTMPRKVIMDILRQTMDHLSAEDIYLKAVNMNPSIGLTTVYRTLDLFYQIGVVQRFDFGDGKARYELISNPNKKEHHHHLVCVKCRNIIDYSDFVHEEQELMDKTEQGLSQKHDFDIFHHIIHFYGICKECKEIE